MLHHSEETKALEHTADSEGMENDALKHGRIEKSAFRVKNDKSVCWWILASTNTSMQAISAHRCNLTVVCSDTTWNK